LWALFPPPLREGGLQYLIKFLSLEERGLSPIYWAKPDESGNYNSLPSI